jgi:quinoprotein glucose dehydrogenase
MRVFLLCLTPILGFSQAQDWTHYGGDSAGSKYSPLRQVNQRNVTQLKVAWTYSTGEASDGKTLPVRTAFETTPLAIGGVLYFTTPFNRVIALDAVTGKEMWTYDPKLDRTRTYSLYISRGLTYWTNGALKRILFGTLDGRLFCLNAADGALVCEISLRAGFADKFPTRGYGVISPPATYKNLVITGSLASDGEPQGPSGDVRAFDIATGKLVWRFHVIPRPGEYGADTWPTGATVDRGGVNAWAPLTVDEPNHLVFLPLTSPATDRFGGDRHGDNLFGNSLVALRAATGERVWHQQLVRHDIWDYDLPAQPNLFTVNGQPYVGQVTKMGLLFIFHRLTGAPLFPVEQREVAASMVPGEKTAATQPFPTLPPPFARNSFRPEDIRTDSPYCQALLKDAATGGPYTPVGTQMTIVFPGTNGGANWGGASIDPRSNTLYVNSMDVGIFGRMVVRNSREMPRSRGGGTIDGRFWDRELKPCQKPPWGQLTAIDLRTGKFRWQSILGTPGTGSPNIGGSMVTADGLVFIGATNDSHFRAFHAGTGKLLWETTLPASAFATPMTYSAGANQRPYIVIAAGGGNDYQESVSDQLIAFTLP